MQPQIKLKRYYIINKAYYKQSIKFHPDKNKSDDAKLKF